MDDGAGVGFPHASKRIDSAGRETIEWNLWSDEQGGCQLNFSLTYRGALPSATGSSTRLPEKHALRKSLHCQLKELWKVQPTLSKMAQSGCSVPGGKPGEYENFLESTANKYRRCGFRFIPLVVPELSLSCAVDVLLLRRDYPGSLIKNGGDIDNRLKTIFDSLRMPDNCSELPKNAVAEADEDPFYVLLKDDSLITKVTVSSDRLLLPADPGERANDVHLVIGVTVNVVAVSYYHGSNTMFLGS